MDANKVPYTKQDSQKESTFDYAHSPELLGDYPQNLAIPTHLERTCSNAQPAIDPESIEHFCRTWAEVGQAILARRNKTNE